MFTRALFPSISTLVLLLVSCSANDPSTTGDSLFGKYLIGRYAENRGDISIATEQFTDVLNHEDDTRLLNHLFLLHLMSGDFVSARLLSTRILQSDPNNTSVLMFLGLSALKFGNYDVVFSAFESLDSTPVGEWVGPIVSAWVLQQAKRRQEAEALLASIKESHALAGFRYFHEALMADLAGDVARAEERYRFAVKSANGTVLRFIEGYGNFLERHGRTNEASLFYKKHLQTDGFAQRLWEIRSRAIEYGEIPEPLVRNGVEGVAELFHGMFMLLSSQGSDGIALSYLPYLRFALFLHPKLHEARLLLGEQYEQAKFFDAALESYNSIPKSSPYYVDAQVRVAQIYKEMEKSDEALELLLRLNENIPDSRVAILSLASFYRINERYDEAIAVYSSMINMLKSPSQEDWNVFYGRAISYERSDRWLEAEADLKVAMHLSDEHPFVLNYLGYSWVEQGEQLNLALDMLKKAAHKRPQNGFIVDSLGWAYYKLGAFDRANYYLERAVELEPGNPVINDHLGDSFWQSGRKLEARFQWRRALGLAPEAEEVTTIEEKLLYGLTP